MQETTNSPTTRRQHQADEFRQLAELEVQHLMRMFSPHFIDTDTKRRPLAEAGTARPRTDAGDLACDEGRIDHAMRATRDGA